MSKKITSPSKPSRGPCEKDCDVPQRRPDERPLTLPTPEKIPVVIPKRVGVK